LISSKDVPGIDRPDKLDVTLEKITDDIPENYLLMLKYMMKNPIIRKGIFQFFYLFLKPLIDKHPEFLEKRRGQVIYLFVFFIGPGRGPRYHENLP